MGNVDVDIYVNQFISFFDKNPEELKILIGDVDKNEFYLKVTEQCYVNVENGEEISLTRPQILKIIVKLRKSEITIFEKTKIYEIHQKTKFGNICLN
jgi:hypothetical protein|tara:strand:- start:59 stop:349 length:291 start_codon:yes stop_codon:yes gene_type:complete